MVETINGWKSCRKSSLKCGQKVRKKVAEKISEKSVEVGPETNRKIGWMRDQKNGLNNG